MLPAMGCKLSEFADKVKQGGPDVAMECVIILKVKRAWHEKGKAAQKKVFINLMDKVLQQLFITKLESEGGKRKLGQTARGKLERDLQEQIRRLGIKGGNDDDDE